MKGPKRLGWIVGIDPGGTTGMAACPFDGDGNLWLGELELHQVSCVNIPIGMDRIVKQLWLYDMEHSGIVVAEEFVARPGGPTDPMAYWPLRLLGALECEVYGWGCAYVTQTPNERSVITDARLRSKGLWRTPKQGGGPHAMDALRHILVYGRKNGMTERYL